MATRTVITSIASLLQAIENCKQSGNREWQEAHEARLSQIVRNYLAPGSGIDRAALVRHECTPNKIVLMCEFHHMNDAGYYDGWTAHKITVRPSFDGIDLTIGGRDRNQIKDYLADTYHYALTQEILNPVDKDAPKV